MAALETHLEEAFAQDIDEIAKSEDVEFATKHFAFVHKYSCGDKPKKETCINQGRELYTNFVHGLKLARGRAFSCMGQCKDEQCFEQCKSDLASRVQALYQPLAPTLDDYLLQFAKH